MSPPARLAARDRLARLLAVIPWVAGQDGATLDDIAARFDYPRDQLLADLQDVVFFVGVHPFTPDALIDVDIREGKVWIRYADWFSKPLRLTAEEGARLLTAGRSVLGLTGESDESGPLLRALAKLQLALGEGAAQAVEVRLGEAPEEILDTLRRAVAEGRRIELDYYSYGRDERSARQVDPARVFSDHGNWYLAGWCHRAEGDRIFRVDRIRTVDLLDDAVEHRQLTADTSFTPSGDDPRVELRLPADARWVIEQYPTEAVTEHEDGTIDVRMAVTAQPWLERLLLRLGPTTDVLQIDDALDADLRSVAARRVLARYATRGAPAADDQ